MMSNRECWVHTALASKFTHSWPELHIYPSRCSFWGVMSGVFWLLSGLFWVLSELFWILSRIFWVLGGVFWLPNRVFWLLSRLLWVLVGVLWVLSGVLWVLSEVFWYSIEVLHSAMTPENRIQVFSIARYFITLNKLRHTFCCLSLDLMSLGIQPSCRRQSGLSLPLWPTAIFQHSFMTIVSFFFAPNTLQTFWAVPLLFLHFPQTLQWWSGLPRSELRIPAMQHWRLPQALWRLPCPTVPAPQLPLWVPKCQTPLAALRASWQ